MKIRDRILAACREMVRSQGFCNITMDNLAQRAGVSKRTLYRYFRSKEEIIEATIDDFLSEVGAEADRVLTSTSNPEEVFNRQIDYLVIRGQFALSPLALNDLRRHYPKLWDKIENFRAERIRIAVEKLIIASGSKLNEEIDIRIIMEVILASIRAILNPQFILENNLTFEQAARHLCTILVRTI